MLRSPLVRFLLLFLGITLTFAWVDYALMDRLGKFWSLTTSALLAGGLAVAATRQFAAASAQAEAGLRARSDFLAAMSHEIRTPMNGVLGMTQLLEDTPLSAEQRDFVRLIQGSGESLLSIINDILDFSKIEAGKLEIEPHPFDLEHLVGDVAELLATRAHAQGIELTVDIPADAPRRLVGDAGRIRQVLTNLIGNAVKFTSDGHVLVRVAYQQHSDPPLLSVAIEDTGIGIAAEHQGNLMQPFTQADISTSRKYGGTGLGLAISRQLVELMGGRMGLQSVEGEGSTFSFHLPLTVAIEEDRVPAQPGDLRGLRVLLVDDLEVNRRIYTGLMESWGIHCVTASGASEALQVLQQADADGERFDLAALDYLMPETDGEALGRAIRAQAQWSHLPLVLLTSSGMRGDRLRFEKAGFDVYLVKPVRSGLLREALAALAQGAGKPCARQHILTRQDFEELRRHQPQSDSAETPQTRRLCVLLAEDNKVNQQVARRMLLKLDCDVEVAENGVIALQMAAAKQYDMCFMDCQMPQMDGFEATRQLRQREVADGPRLPIVAMTANAMKGDEERCLQAGMDDYVSKPVSAEKLAAVLLRARKAAA